MSFIPSTTTRATVNNYVTTLLIPLVTIVGLIVLMALHVLTPADGLPLVGVLAGVHGGATIANNSSA